MNTPPRLAFNVLVKPEDGLWVAHCLELDIVATGDSPNASVEDIRDLILCQVSNAIANKNMEYLYHPAPAKIWEEYGRAQRQSAKKSETLTATPAFSKTIFANVFNSSFCHA